MLCRDVSSRYTRRNRAEYEKIASYLREMTHQKKGNYLAFFPSYRMMLDVYDIFEEENQEEVECVLQKSGMQEREREEFLARLKREKRKEVF